MLGDDLLSNATMKLLLCSDSNCCHLERKSLFRP